MLFRSDPFDAAIELPKAEKPGEASVQPEKAAEPKPAVKPKPAAPKPKAKPADEYDLESILAEFRDL